MAYNIKADVDTVGQIIVQGKNTGTVIKTTEGVSYTPDANGNINLNLPDETDVQNIFKSFPVSQFGELYSSMSLNITSTGYVVNFNRQIPLFMCGELNNLPITNIDLTTIKANPASTTFRAYVQFILGTPQYTISTVDIPESDTTMYIGLISTNTTNINTISIDKVSRFEQNRPSTTNKGSAFPVSVGTADSPGTINW